VRLPIKRTNASCGMIGFRDEFGRLAPAPSGALQTLRPSPFWLTSCWTPCRHRFWP